MAASTFVKNLYQATLQLRDGTGSPVVLTMVGEMGDLAITGLRPETQMVSDYYSRGVYDSSALADHQPIGGSFSFKAKEYFDASTGAPIDFLLRTGGYSANVSVLGTGTNVPYAINMLYTIEGTNFGDTGDHTVTLTKCIIDTVDYQEGDPNVFSVKFRCVDAQPARA